MTYDLMIKRAMLSEIYSFNGMKNELNNFTLRSTAEFFALASENANNPSENLAKRILVYIRLYIAGGNEPCMDSWRNWHYPAFAAGMAMCKKQDNVWSKLSEEEKSKIDLLMKCLTVITAFISNDGNSYRTGVGLRGGVQKSWNPNIRVSLVAPIVFCGDYFGGSDKIDEILTNFSYQDTMEQLRNFGFKNIIEPWSTETQIIDNTKIRGAQCLLELPGKAYIYEQNKNGGYNVFPAMGGKGAKRPYLCKEMRAADPNIIKDLLDYIYSGGSIISEVNFDDIHTGIVDGTESPYKGQNGMFLEFNNDGDRSDAWHCSINFGLAVCLIRACDVLGIGDFSSRQDIKNGNNDLFYKLEHGYTSLSQGRVRDVFEKDTNADFEVYKQIWNNFYE